MVGPVKITGSRLFNRHIHAEAVPTLTAAITSVLVGDLRMVLDPTLPLPPDRV